MSTAMRLLAGIILASIFLGMFIGLYTAFTQGGEMNEFRRDAGQMAQTISFMASQDVGAQQPVDIVVPADCELRFEGQSVIAVANGTQAYDAEISVTGDNLDPGSYHLMLVRTESGVEVNER